MSNMIKRSYLYFFVSFVGTGLQNVIPQVFFDTYYAANRELLLSICLLFGAVASILGTIGWSRSAGFQQPQNASRFKLTTFVTISLLGFSLLGLFSVVHAFFFIFLFVITKVLSQYLVNTVDDHYVRSTDVAAMNEHAQRATLFQLIGIVIAPVYFSLLYGKAYVNASVLFLFSALAMYMILSSISGETKTREARQAEENEETLEASDRLFLLYIITTSSATLIFSANIIYLLQDYFQLDSPIQKGGLLLGVINLAAILGVVFQKLISKTVFGRKGDTGEAVHSLRIHLTIPALSLPLIFLVYIKISNNLFILAFLFALMGILYGLFRMFTREHASLLATTQNKRKLLTMYNNMSNYSILLASLTIFCLSLLTKASGWPFLTLMLWSVMGFFLISIVAVVYFAKCTTKQIEAEKGISVK